MHPRLQIKLVYGLSACACCILLLFQLHGFSMAIWGEIIPDASAVTPLFGKPRHIRSDDWMAQLPAIISQTWCRPPYPSTNHIMHPDGHEMVLGMSVPVCSWIAFFKPTTWGYFISPDFGMSWHWQFRVFLLFLSAFAFFHVVIKVGPMIALWGALCLLLSSFFSYWSFISEPITGFALLATVLVYRVLTNVGLLAVELAVLYWALVAFVVNMLYPPFQIPLIYFVCTIGAWIVYEQNKVLQKHVLRSLGRVIAVVCLSACTVGLHFYENRDVLLKVLHTDYPGARFSTGGDLNVGHMFAMSLLPLRRFPGFPELNISEAGSSFFVGFFCIPAFALSWRQTCPRARRLAVILCVVTGLLAVFSFIGVPALLAKVSGWSRVPGPRTLGLWCVLNTCWLVWWAEFCPRNLDKKRFAYWISAVAVGLGLIAVVIEDDLTFLTQKKILLGAILMVSVAVGLQGMPRCGRLAVIAILAVGSLSFNPIDRCTFTQICRLPIVEKLKKEFAVSGKKAVLLLDGDLRTANFLRVIGVPSYGGMQFVPQVGFWQTLDPSGTYSRKWNRFAHVSFARAPAKSPTYFATPQGDVLRVYLSERDVEQFSQEALVKETLWGDSPN